MRKLVKDGRERKVKRLKGKKGYLDYKLGV